MWLQDGTTNDELPKKKKDAGGLERGGNLLGSMKRQCLLGREGRTKGGTAWKRKDTKSKYGICRPFFIYDFQMHTQLTNDSRGKRGRAGVFIGADASPSLGRMHMYIYVSTYHGKEDGRDGDERLCVLGKRKEKTNTR